MTEEKARLTEQLKQAEEDATTDAKRQKQLDDILKAIDIDIVELTEFDDNVYQKNCRTSNYPFKRQDRSPVHRRIFKKLVIFRQNNCRQKKADHYFIIIDGIMVGFFVCKHSMGLKKTPLFYYNNQHQEKRFGGSKRVSDFQKNFLKHTGNSHGYWVPPSPLNAQKGRKKTGPFLEGGGPKQTDL